MKLLDYNSFINQDRQKTQSVNEHLWSGIIHRSETGEERNEDLFCSTKEDIRRKIQEIIDKTHPSKGDTIDLNHLIVSGVEDMSDLFYDHRMNIDFTDYNFNISKWDVSNVKDMNWMFHNCENFNCDLSKWNVSKVTDMISMFNNCKNFNCDLSGWKVSNVEYMNGMFENCKKFNSDLSKWDVSNVKEMSYMFEGCENFNSDLSKWDVSNVKEMWGMFYNCENFNSDLSGWDVSNMTDMQNMFNGCSSLEKIPDWYHD